MKKLIAICAVAAMFLAVSGIASGEAVQSGGWANVDYTISSLPDNATERQHTHAEAGFDIATGTPVSVDDDYTTPGYSYAYAETSHSWGEGEADTSLDYLRAANYASAGGSALESWGYGSTVYRVDFTLDTAQTIDIGYLFTGKIWVDSDSSAGSGFSTGLLSIEIDDVLVYDSDPNCDHFVEVTGIGYEEKTLSDSGTISHQFATGAHQIAFFVDTYENAAVPEPSSAVAIIGLLATGGALWWRRRRRGATRAPWSEENRQAIRHMIDHGRTGA